MMTSRAIQTLPFAACAGLAFYGLACELPFADVEPAKRATRVFWSSLQSQELDAAYDLVTPEMQRELSRAEFDDIVSEYLRSLAACAAPRLQFVRNDIAVPKPAPVILTYIHRCQSEDIVETLTWQNLDGAVRLSAYRVDKQSKQSGTAPQ